MPNIEWDEIERIEQMKKTEEQKAKAEKLATRLGLEIHRTWSKHVRVEALKKAFARRPPAVRAVAFLSAAHALYFEALSCAIEAGFGEQVKKIARKVKR